MSCGAKFGLAASKEFLAQRLALLFPKIEIFKINYIELLIAFDAGNVKNTFTLKTLG